MKLSDFLTDVGRPIAYYPGLRRITGSTTATVFVCQLLYWTGKEKDGDGWIYKVSDEIENETGLSYDEQKTAREKLLAAGLIEEKYARLEHRMYFKVNLETLNELWGNGESDIRETGNTALGKAESPDSLNRNLTENTSQNTNNGAKEKDAPTLPLEWQIAAGKETVELQTEDQEWRANVDLACMGICRYGMDLELLARSFIDARRILPGKKSLKGWGAAFREMKSKGVTEKDIRTAIKQLSDGGMTIADPWSVQKTAISLANPMPSETTGAVQNGLAYL
jgi:hypothetical protein